MKKYGSAENLPNIKITEIAYEQIIPFLCGRPIRSTSINQDDCINLRIALYTCKTLEEFLESV